MMPFASKLELGDFGQIQSAGFRPLGNIAKIQLVHTIKSTDFILLNPADWQLELGLEKTIGSMQTQADGQENVITWNTQTLTFKQKGDFIFHGVQPKACFISNWSDFKSGITLKFTQADYSFRDVYIVTAIASVNHWGFAIAGEDCAQLELAAQMFETDHFTLLSHENVVALQNKHIASFEKSAGRETYFFKAKKLVLSDKKKDMFLNQLFQLEPCERANWLSSNLINRVQANELTPNTCLDYFDWVDTSLDDVERLC